MLRRIISAVLAVAIALPQGAFAQQAFYFRHAVSSVATPTNPGTPGEEGPVRGTGDLAIYLPVQVRARLGVPFSLQLTAQNATGTIAWSSIGTAIPDGLTFNPGTGLISGVPTAIQTSQAARFKGVDANGKWGESPSLIIDVQPVPTITVSPSYTAKTGDEFALRPNARPVFGSQAWTLSGQLPLGLSLNPNTGSISGTPRQQGTYTGLRLSVTDADGATGSSSEFAIAVTSSINIAGLPSKISARLARAMNEIRPTATGTPGPYTWTVSEEGTPLPAGLSLNSSTGAISGTAVSTGNATGVALKVVDSTTGASTISAPVSINVADAPTIAVSATYNFRQGQGAKLLVRPQASNLLAGGYWSMSRSVPGYEFSYSNGSLFGDVGGIASYPGVTFTVVDLFDGATATSAPTTINIVKGLKIEAPSVPAARVNKPFTMAAPVVEGLIGTPTWSISGGLPAGLSIDTVTGIVSGTPTTVGAVQTSLQVRDSVDGIRAISRDFRIDVRPEEEPIAFEIAAIPESLPASTNTFFKYTPTVSGAKGTVSWSLTGSLPSWALFEPATGTIAGTPASPEVISGLSYRATDSADNAQAISSTFSIAVTPSAPMAISMPETLQAKVAEEITTAVPTVSGGQGGQFYALATGRVPEGLTFDTLRGRFSGLPTVSGDLSGLSILVTDQVGNSAVSNYFDFSIAPSDSSPTVSMASRIATTGQEFAAAPSVANAFAPLTWAVDSGTLPSWATLNTTSGVISGVPPQAEVSGAISLIVTDRFGRGGRSSPFTISVVDAPVFSASIASLTATQGSTFGASPSVVGARGAVTWSVSSGTLPPGLGLNATTGHISGVPSTVGAFQGIVLSGQDSTGATTSTNAFAITVAPSPLSMEAYPAELAATYGTPFTAPAPVVRGARGTLVWSLISGTLPSWASFDPATGRISGTPDALTETGGLRVRVTDENGTNAQTTIFKIPVKRQTLTASVPSSLGFHVNTPISSAAPTMAGLIGSPSFTLTAGTLPSGLVLNSATGVISGTLSAPASSAGLILTLTDSFDQATARTNSFTISVMGDPQITVASEYPGARDEGFSASPSVTNAVGVQNWTIESGTLPSWASLSATTGKIFGTPTQIETSTGISLRMTDAAGGSAVSAPFSIAIGSSFTPSALSAVPTLVWSMVGTLPAGLSFDTATGRISGTPTAPGSANDLRLVVRDGDGLSATSRAFTITVNAASTTFTATMPSVVNFKMGVATSVSPTLNGATGSSQTYSLQWYSGANWYAASSANLPTGVSFDTTKGVISGTPTTTTSSQSYRIVVIDYRSPSNVTATTNQFTFSIDAWTPIQVTTAPKYDIVRGQEFGMQPAVTGNVGETSYTLQAASGGSWVAFNAAYLPAGITFNPANGSISGTTVVPNVPMTTFRILVRDARNVTAYSNQFVLGIANWEMPRITLPNNVTVNRGQSIEIAPIIQGVAGTIQSMGLQGLSGGNYFNPGTAVMPGVTFNPATGVISGIPTSSLSSYQAYRIWLTENRNGQVQTVYSNQLVITVNDWATPTISIDSSVKVARGVPAVITPTVTGVSGTLGNFSVYGLSGGNWATASLPQGMTLNTTTGVISGTPQAATSPQSYYRLYGQETRQGQTFGFSSNAFAINITDWSPPTIVYPLRTSFVIGAPITIQPVVENVEGTTNYNLYYYNGTALSASSDGRWLPNGLAFDRTTGQITGTPTAGTYGTGIYYVNGTETRSVGGVNQNIAMSAPNFHIEAAPASGTPTLSYGNDNTVDAVANGQVDAAPALAGAAQVTGPYTLTFTPITGLTGGKVNYVNSLPAGMTFNSTTGRFTASALGPSTGGRWYGYKVCAPTPAGQACGTVTFNIADRPNVVVDVMPYIDGTRRQSLNVVPTARNAVGAVSWTLQAQIISVNALNAGEFATASMPPGLTFNGSTGAISGTPTQAGIFRGYRLVATDSQGASFRGQTQEIIIRIADVEPFTLTAPGIIDVNVNEPVDFSPVPAGNVGSVVWNGSLTILANTINDGQGTFRQNALPLGLSYDASRGRILGTPAVSLAEGLYRGYRICGTDELARSACTGEIIIRVQPKPVLAVKVPLYVTVRQGEAVQIVPNAENAYGTPVWNSVIISGSAPVLNGHNGDFVSGSLPPGLSYSAATGTIQGTVSLTTSPGRWRGYKIAVRDGRNISVNSDEIIIEVVTGEPLAIQAPLVTEAVRGQPISIQATASNVIGTLAWNPAIITGASTAQNGTNGDYVSGSLPPGLTYSAATGMISGTVTAATAPGRWRGYKFGATDSRNAGVTSDEIIINVQ
jgi:hypothetical protein